MTEALPPKNRKTVLKKVPRIVIYAVALVASLLLVAGVVAEVNSPGSVEDIVNATDTVVSQAGVIIAALAAAAGPVLALLNLTEDEPT